MNRITYRYTKEELESHGLSVVYLVNPSTFCPFVKIMDNNDIMWSASMGFNRTDDEQEIYDYIDKKVYDIIYKNRKEKIKKM